MSEDSEPKELRVDRKFAIQVAVATPPSATITPPPASLDELPRYGYPAYHVVGDSLYAIYSISKEDIACMRMPPAKLA